MTLLEAVNIIYTICGFIGIMLLAHKNKMGFVVFFVVEVCMGYIGYKTQQQGLVVMAVVYFLSNMYALYRWRK